MGLVRYPDSAIETVDPRFEAYVLPNAAVERLHTGSRWAEGPVWFGDGRYFVWSDIPNDRMLRVAGGDRTGQRIQEPVQLLQREHTGQGGASRLVRARHQAGD